VALVNSPAFINEILDAYGPAPSDPEDERSSPWNLGGGGLETTASKVLDGGEPFYDKFLKKRKPTDPPMSEGERNKVLLEGIITVQQGRGGDMVLMGTNGDSANHAFNTLPNDPSVADLQPPDIGDKIDAKLIEPGKKIATTKLPAEQTAAVFEETVRAVMESVHPDDRDIVMETLNALPSTALSPTEIKDAIIAAVTQKEIDDFLLYDEPGATPERIAEVRRDFTENNEDWIGEEIGLALTQQMRPPEVVVADTNWGDAESQVQFVLIPDATSGELVLFKKDTFTGKLTLAGENWTDAKWDTTRR
jgi:hypothetical protein